MSRNIGFIGRGYGPRLLVALFAVTLAVGLAGQVFAPARADAAGPPAGLPVGHTVKQIVVPGSLPYEYRKVDVHLWYPADPRGLSDRPETVYRSALWGRCSSTSTPAAMTPCDPAPLLPAGWTALSWEVKAEVAREDAPIDPHGPAYPVIVFSHGANNDPIDYAYTLEELARAGFVVAAPYHVNNTQDDVLIDYINDQAGTTVFPCNDGLPPKLPTTTWYAKSDCQRLHLVPPGVPNPAVPNNMRDRVRDISYVLNELPGWFGDRVDLSHGAGVLGHSRGTVTALTAAGGSTTWDIPAEPRVTAVMGMAIGARPITFGANLANVRVPTVLVAGGLDKNSDESISEDAFAAISSPYKLFVGIPNAVHRSFDSTYCAELQSAAAQVKSDSNAKAILDRHTVGVIAASEPGFISGKAVHYCAPQYFTGPVNIQRVVASIPNSEYFCPPGTEGPPGLGDQLDPSCHLIAPTTGPTTCPTNIPLTQQHIPCTGLDTNEVKQGIVKIAAAFFDSALKRTGHDPIDFKRYLAPKWLMEHVPMVGSACTGPDTITPPDQSIICSF